MGSKTSTRWKGHTPKLTIDDCYALTVEGLDKLGLLGEKLMGTGSLTWWPRVGAGTTLTYVASIINRDDRRYHGFTFVHPFTQAVYVERKSYRVGGVKWLIICPNQDCRRRVNAVYRPPDQNSFACRQCLGLGYASNRKRKSEPRYSLDRSPFNRSPAFRQQVYDKQWRGQV